METNVKITYYSKNGKHFCHYDSIPVLYEVESGKPVIWFKSENMFEQFQREIKRMKLSKVCMLVFPLPDTWEFEATKITSDKLREFFLSVG